MITIEEEITTKDSAPIKKTKTTKTAATTKDGVLAKTTTITRTKDGVPANTITITTTKKDGVLTQTTTTTKDGVPEKTTITTRKYEVPANDDEAPAKVVAPASHSEKVKPLHMAPDNTALRTRAYNYGLTTQEKALLILSCSPLILVTGAYLYWVNKTSLKFALYIFDKLPKNRE